MKLAGVLPKSAGYPIDNPPAMVWAALRDVIVTCRRYGIEPVGALEMSVTHSMPSFPEDVALRWEFTPDDDDVEYYSSRERQELEESARSWEPER